MQMKKTHGGNHEIFSFSKPRQVDDMTDMNSPSFDIRIIDGERQLILKGATIGTEEEIMTHLRKSAGYDDLVEAIHEEEKQELFLHGGVTNE